MKNISPKDLFGPYSRSAMVGVALGAIFVAGALAVLSAVPAMAGEEGRVVPVTADEFLARVEKSNPGFAAIDSEVAASDAAVTAARLWDNPRLAYEREEIFSGDRSYPENTLSLELPLEISGRRILKTQGAEMGARATREGATKSRNDLRLDALRLYLEASAARSTWEALTGERAGLGSLFEAVKLRAAAGDASRYEEDRLALEAESLEDLIGEAGRTLTALRRSLGLAAGEPGAQLEAADPLSLPSLPEKVASDKLLAAHPEYAAADLRVKQAEKELAAANRGWVPSLVLSGGTKDAVIGTTTRSGYVAGVDLSLPVFDYGQAEAKVARARLAKAQAERRSLEQKILAEAGAKDDLLGRTVEQARRFEESQLPRLKKLIDRAEISYREGEIQVFELLDAYRTARAVRLRAIELKLRARQAEIDVWRSRGLGPGGKP